jgi:hypothetical protein
LLAIGGSARRGGMVPLSIQLCSVREAAKAAFIGVLQRVAA